MGLIRLIVSAVFVHGLISNPNRQGDNVAFVKDALGLADTLLEALTPNPEDSSDESNL